MLNLKWTDLIPLTKDGVSKINNVAGVYKLSYYDEESYVVYYVGQASDLRVRLNQHTVDGEMDRCCLHYLKKYNCFFRAAAISYQADRDGAEVSLHNEYRPHCVEKTPDVRPLEINLI